jgi:predicted metal-binding protein
MTTPLAPQPTTLYVCTQCDRNPAHHESKTAEGHAFYKTLTQHFAAQEHLHIKPIECLGGCECNGTPNGCCSIGITSAHGHAYVINQLNPAADIWKLEELLRLYAEHPQGRILSRNSPHTQALLPHIATRVPPALK